MPQALVTTLDATVSGPDVGSLRKFTQHDPIEAAGSLFLTEPNHPDRPWSSGIPVSGALVPNVLWEKASAAIGAGTSSTLSGQVLSNNIAAGGVLVERTGKGGVHSVISPTFAVNTSYFNMDLPQLVADWVRTNPAHNYYVSIWERLTRAITHSTDGQVLWNNLQTSTKFAWSFQGAAPAISAGTLLGSRYGSPKALGPNLLALGVDPDDLLSSTGSITNKKAWASLAGSTTTADAGSYGKGGSRVLYRTYVEDLTVSGRSYQDALDIDLDLYTKHVLTIGGRYYADTYTDPATIV